MVGSCVLIHVHLQGLANKLRQVYNLTLFNFDLIQPDPSVDLGTHLYLHPLLCTLLQRPSVIIGHTGQSGPLLLHPFLPSVCPGLSLLAV